MAAEGKFKQPWRGVLSLLTIYAISYTAYAVFLNPVKGLLSRLVVGDAFLLRNLLEYAVSRDLAALLAPVLATRSAEVVALNPLGYPLDWMSVVVFSIVWFIAIALLFAPLERKEPPKQPKTGLIVAFLSLVLAFLTFWVLGSVFRMNGYEMLLLGTCGFLVFPIWATLFNYWPFVPKKPDVHPAVRGAIYTMLSWAITVALYCIINMLAWREAVFFEMYTPSHDLFTTLLSPLFPFKHYDKWLSFLVAVILGCNIVGLVNPFGKKSQPARGGINLVIAAVIGVALWLILMPILGKAPHFFTLTIETIVTVRIPLVVTVSSPSNVTVYLLYVILAILIIRYVFEMHWFTGTRGSVLAVVSAFIAGTLLFFATTAITPVAVFLSGADAAMYASGLQALTNDAIITYIGYALGLRWYAGPMLLTALSYMLESQAALQHLAVTLTFGWFVLASIMWLLIYTSFDHWPWK
ncbi:MAG: hypothetical protein QXK94_04030 [Candidatus Jordarchaeales archaeon]